MRGDLPESLSRNNELDALTRGGTLMEFAIVIIEATAIQAVNFSYYSGLSLVSAFCGNDDGDGHDEDGDDADGDSNDDDHED